MKRFARPLAVCAALLAFPATAAAHPDVVVAAKAPTGLRAFLLRPDEPVAKTDGVAEFSRTPSFAWTPVSGATRYEFELATSKGFSGSGVIWTNVKDDVETPAGSTPTAGGTAPSAPAASPAAPPATSVYDTLRTPAVALDIALPWITGSPAALYAHVRAITKDGPTRWSAPLGLNIRWSSIPVDLQSLYPGLIRWSPVEGATSYEVWLSGARLSFHTTTNVADTREFYTFHQVSPWTSSVSYRVRARRNVYGEVASGLPTTSYGPWSPVYTNVQPPLSLGSLSTVGTVSDFVSTADHAVAHGLTPGFVFNGNLGGPADYLGGASAELYRVYVATDKDCVNIVFRGAIVGSPAYAPRLSGPLALPTDDQAIAKARTKILPFGSEGKALMVDGTPSVATEAGTGAASSSSSSSSPSSGSSSSAPSVSGPKIDLPDTAWPTGGYYWTVVPVHALPVAVDNPPPPPAPPAPGAPAVPPPPVPVEYRETELPQDACQAGRVQRFGKTSPPVLTGASRPFASGLSPKGRLVSAVRSRPSFYGTPLVAWQPALGAQDYEVQWSTTGNPFKPVGSIRTPATSALLPLAPGTWSYRVRGFNSLLPKRPQLAWSSPIAITIAKPVFHVVKR
jgi:hypothetical protein